jgi:hypothetical protein
MPDHHLEGDVIDDFLTSCTESTTIDMYSRSESWGVVTITGIQGYIRVSCSFGVFHVWSDVSFEVAMQLFSMSRES